MGETRTDMTLAAVTANREAELAEARRRVRTASLASMPASEAEARLVIERLLERFPALGERRVVPSALGSDRLRRRARVTR